MPVFGLSDIGGVWFIAWSCIAGIVNGVKYSDLVLLGFFQRFCLCKSTRVTDVSDMLLALHFSTFVFNVRKLSLPTFLI